MTRLPRTLHPGAWWLWALGLATAASRTTNPLLLALIVVVAGVVVATRRGDAPWAFAFRYYLWAGLFVVVPGWSSGSSSAAGTASVILVTLPEVPLPEWAAGIRLFGPVTAEQVLGGLYDGLRLATMLICLGAANALANPKRLLQGRAGRAVRGRHGGRGGAVGRAAAGGERAAGARGPAGCAAAGSAGCGRCAASRCRCWRTRWTGRCALAAAMDSRGYGRRAGVVPPRCRRRWSSPACSASASGCTGCSTRPRRAYLGLPMLVLGLVLAGVGLPAAGRRVRRSVYRPDRWRAAESLVAASGLAAAGGADPHQPGRPADLYPSLSPADLAGAAARRHRSACCWRCCRPWLAAAPAAAPVRADRRRPRARSAVGAAR